LFSPFFALSYFCMCTAKMLARKSECAIILDKNTVSRSYLLGWKTVRKEADLIMLNTIDEKLFQLEQTQFFWVDQFFCIQCFKKPIYKQSCIVAENPPCQNAHPVIMFSFGGVGWLLTKKAFCLPCYGQKVS
jgi:hypothetical protein